MKSTALLATFAAVAALATASLPAPVIAATPELQIPDFSHLRGKARESVDITVDGFLMKIARKFAAAEADRDVDLRLLSDIESVRVRNFEFDSEGEYSAADIESVRRQLNAPGWSALAQVRKREPQENVDVYMCIEGEKILGIAVIASEPKSFTIVNVIGNIDVDKLAKLEGQFGIPRVETGNVDTNE